MIEEIRISSLGVIEESVLELGDGLTVITGETGAGKTMVVTALGLLLGGRADSGAVRTGAGRRGSRASSAPDDGLGASPTSTVARSRPASCCWAARSPPRAGRGRSSAARPCPRRRWPGWARSLVAVHGQSDQHRLLRPEAQREALDAFAGAALAAALAGYRAGYARLRAVEAELREVLGSARERAREADVLRLGLEEIEAVDPQPRRGRCAGHRGGAARLRRHAARRRPRRRARRSRPSRTRPTRSGAVGAARRALESVREHDPEAAALADRVAEVSYLLADVAADVASYATAVETDPARLAAVSERRAALTALTRKYGETVDEVLEWAGTPPSGCWSSTAPTSGSPSCAPSGSELAPALAGRPPS